MCLVPTARRLSYGLTGAFEIRPLIRDNDYLVDYLMV
jgi:hypothetical protein